MSKLNVLNENLEVVGDCLEYDKFLEDRRVSLPSVHQAIVAHLANKRNINATTKTKAMVSGGGKKPFKQKGTGRARQGSTRSPLMPGGGVVFGPNVGKNYLVKVNKKQKKVAMSTILIDKVESGRVKLLKSLPSFSKTKDLATYLKKMSVKNCILVPANESNGIYLSGRNIPGVCVRNAESVSIYDLLKHEYLLVDEVAIARIIERCTIWSE